MHIRNSLNSPIRIDALAVPGQPGLIGLTLCPGKKGPSAWGQYHWDRDLIADASTIARWQPDVWLNLMEEDEMLAWRVPGLPAVAAGVCDYAHAAIVDQRAPGRRFEAAWRRIGPSLRRRIRAGERVLVHCRGGLGRAGTVAARLLVEFGVPPQQAIGAVRSARHGAIETGAQEAYVRALTPVLGLGIAEGQCEAEDVPARPTARNAASRVRGGLLGLLVGDALGVPHEFKAAERIPPEDEIEMVMPPAYRRTYAQVPYGTWSDDGAQALCLAESLVARGGLDVDDLAQRLLAWRDRGHLAVDGRVFDIGIQTSQALNRLRQGVPALQAGATAPSSCGNGSLMRVLPLALWNFGSVDGLFEAAMMQSRITHGHARAQLACALYCGVAWRLLRGDAVDSALESAIAELRRYCAVQCPTFTDELEAEVLGSRYRAAPSGSGYVVDTLWSALACLQESDYASVVRAAIALGNDTDTTAAVAGGLAGIVFGEEGIPVRWLTALRGRAVAEGVVERFVAECGGTR